MQTTQTPTADETASTVALAVRANRRGPASEWVSREWLIAQIDYELRNSR